MNIAEKSLKVTYDFDKRFCGNFLEKINNISSQIYFVTLDKKISAHSIVGILSANIKSGNIIRINAINIQDKKQAERDLAFIESVILNDM